MRAERAWTTNVRAGRGPTPAWRYPRPVPRPAPQPTPPSDDPRYQRLLAATRDAARHGYDAVSMRELAETCRLSMTTIYQFCRSKDRLIAEAHLDTMRSMRDQLVAHPPTGSTAHARVGKVMRAYARALDADEELLRTLLRAMYSSDPEVTDTRASVGGAYRALLDAAIGDEPLAARDAIITTLGHVIDSVVLGWLTRTHDASWVAAELQQAVDLLVPAPPA